MIHIHKVKFYPSDNNLHKRCLWCLWQIWSLSWCENNCCSKANLELTDHRGHTAIMRAACQWAPISHIQLKHCERPKDITSLTILTSLLLSQDNFVCSFHNITFIMFILRWGPHWRRPVPPPAWGKSNTCWQERHSQSHVSMKCLRNDKTVMHLAALNNRAEVILLLLRAKGGEDLVNTNDQVRLGFQKQF